MLWSWRLGADNGSDQDGDEDDAGNDIVITFLMMLLLPNLAIVFTLVYFFIPTLDASFVIHTGFGLLRS